jgi:hypothetical protein
MCAEIEGEDATHSEVFGAYAPPLLGTEDSPRERILALLTEPEKAVFLKRAIESGGWEDVAAAAGKPLHTVGPIFARVAARIARLFGSPPPMDDDLVPVFARAAVDPHRPEGRAVSLQLDAVFYAVTPEMHKIGLATSYDARILVLWDAAGSATPPGDDLRCHLDRCHYCTDLLRALILVRQALLRAPGVAFHLCPGAFTLAIAPDTVREAFDQHLAQCSICRAERTQVLDGQAPRPVGDLADQDSNAGAGRKIAWASAAILFLGVASFAGYRYYAARQADAPKIATSQAVEQQIPTVTRDPRYQDLVQNVKIDDARVMASVLPQDRAVVTYLLGQFSLGDPAQALTVSAQLATRMHDPGAQMLYAMSLFKLQLTTDAYREMLKSEAMSPRESFRCWIMFQFALMVGDRKIVDREAEHLSDDPQYVKSVKAIMDKVRERG